MSDIKIRAIVVAYALADDLLKLFEAANAPNIEWRFFLHSNIAEVRAVCSKLEAENDNVVSLLYGENRGLSTSWNEGILYAYEDELTVPHRLGGKWLRPKADVAIIINDDMLPGPGDVQKVAEAAMAHPEYGIIKCMGTDMRSGSRTPMEYGLTAITKRGWDVVGCFDENISPIYWEDIDHGKRMREAGLLEYIVQDTSAVHAGSKTSVVMPDGFNLAQQAYDRNMHYYVTKWGGTHMGGEKFKYPFNDAHIGYKIDPGVRHDPYAQWGITNRTIPKG